MPGSRGRKSLLAFRPEGVEACAAESDGAWVGVVRSSVYVGGHVEYVVELGGFALRAIGPLDPRLPHESRARLSVSPRRTARLAQRGRWRPPSHRGERRQR